jgi:inosose dehydratase
VDPTLLARLQGGEIGYGDAVGAGLYCDLGRGMVDWPGLAKVIDEVGYEGWVLAEEDQLLVPGCQAPFASNIANRAFLAQLFGVS